MSTLISSFFIVMLMANLTLSALVPRIQDDSIQLEPLDDNKYFLRIQNSDGTVREETVEEVAPGEFQVIGVLNQPYADKDGRLVLTYEAGRNGYVAKYSYTTQQGQKIPPPLSLSPGAIKSITG